MWWVAPHNPRPVTGPGQLAGQRDILASPKESALLPSLPESSVPKRPFSPFPQGAHSLPAFAGRQGIF